MITDGKKFIKKKPVLSSLLLSVCAAFIFRMSDGAASTGELILSVLLIGLCFIYPLILTLINMIALFYIPKDIIWRKNLKRFEYITLILGVIDSCLVSEFLKNGWNIVMDAKWNEVLQNSQKHQPVWTDAAPNVIVDEHYLCTVAAGGHAGIVKPLRMGERHGHRVVVNRQLCIANAFEQILEERVPRFHRLVRNVYDSYGLPVARLIRTKFAADIVYICMKPLEWMFLIVIYLCDVKPENRIAVQYLPRRQ